MLPLNQSVPEPADRERGRDPAGGERLGSRDLEITRLRRLRDRLCENPLRAIRHAPPCARRRPRSSDWPTSHAVARSLPSSATKTLPSCETKPASLPSQYTMWVIVIRSARWLGRRSSWRPTRSPSAAPSPRRTIGRPERTRRKGVASSAELWQFQHRGAAPAQVHPGCRPVPLADDQQCRSRGRRESTVDDRRS